MSKLTLSEIQYFADCAFIGSDYRLQALKEHYLAIAATAYAVRGEILCSPPEWFDFLDVAIYFARKNLNLKSVGDVSELIDNLRESKLMLRQGITEVLLQEVQRVFAMLAEVLENECLTVEEERWFEDEYGYLLHSEETSKVKRNNVVDEAGSLPLAQRLVINSIHGVFVSALEQAKDREFDYSKYHYVYHNAWFSAEFAREFISILKRKNRAEYYLCNDQVALLKEHLADYYIANDAAIFKVPIAVAELFIFTLIRLVMKPENEQHENDYEQIMRDFYHALQIEVQPV